MNQNYDFNLLRLALLCALAWIITIAIVFIFKYWIGDQDLVNSAELSHVIVNNKPFEIIERY